MITAVFTDNSDYARATGLWQWDYGQRLRIEGLHLPTAVEIHFALTEQSGDAITRVGTTKDGVTEVVIPDSLLENQAAGATYEIYAWIYLADTPIERNLTPEELAAYEALHTNYPITVITNDAGAHMETSYVADTKAYINKKFEKRLPQSHWL